MMRINIILVCLALFCGCESKSRMEPGWKQFDQGWLFYRGDLNGNELVNIGDSKWRSLDLPHDWSIEDIPGTGTPFDSTVANGVSSGFTRGGIGWYRKHFRLEDADSGKVYRLLFDGIYMNSNIWVNGNYAGGHFYGYSSFPVDITPFLKFGEDNLISVRVENSTVKSRWYSGSGIYRHVWLSVSEGVYIDTWGIQISTPEISEKQADIKVNTTIRSEFPGKDNVSVKIRILDRENNEMASLTKEIEIADQSPAVEHHIVIDNPRLWNLDDPFLYQAEVTVLDNGTVSDRNIQNFGIRKILFDTVNGFSLNGKTIELKGGCIHHDNGPLGACAFDRAEERKVELLKSAGFNAIRFAHNPPSPAILDACDRLGMLAIDESFDVWRYGHFEGDYGTRFDSLWMQDIDHMVKRDFNHPSVIMWSIGNEIVNSATEEIAGVCGELSDYVRKLDGTRPVTSAANQISEAKDPYFSHLDVSGYNYSPGSYEADHARKPERIMFGSESFAMEFFDYWKNVEEFPYVIGDFVWTAFDYIGEASIGWRGYPQKPDFYPWKLAYCGDFDLTGYRRPQSYYRQTIWDSAPTTSIYVQAPVPSFPLNPEKEYWSVWDWPDVLQHWNFEGYQGKTLKVFVYSRCEEVELLLNGKSLGKKSNNQETKNILFWEVPYSAGKLMAIGYNNQNRASESFIETAGDIENMKLSADRTEIKADGQDLSFINIELEDSKGILNMIDDRLVKFEVSGAGTLAAVANANPISSESFQMPQRMTWRGKCMVIIRARNIPGKIKIIAHSENLPDKEIIISAN